MARADKTYRSFVTSPAPRTCYPDQPAFLRAILALIDVVEEALALQNAAHKRRHFNNE
jgi:hypothetical protein